MIKIITTVGTSLFTNYTKNEVRDSFLNDDYQNISDELKKLEKLSSSDYNNQKSGRTIDKVKSVIENKWLKGLIKKDDEWEIKENALNQDASAEIKSILKIIEKGKDYKIYFLQSDTVLSRLAAEILSSNMKQFTSQNIEIVNLTINNLVAESFEKFNQGLTNLVRKIREIIKNELALKFEDTFSAENLRKISNEFIFNISGGYKATLPYLTLLAQLYKIESKYIFEESEEMISIPNINIGLDELFIEKIFMDLSSNTFQDMLSKSQLENYGLIQKENKRFELTALGEMVKDYAENHTASAKNIFGYIVEFKLFEYFINNPISLNGKQLKKVERSVQYQREFDIVLSNEKENIFCFCESKAFRTFERNIDKIKDEYKQRIEAIRNYFPNVNFEYRFYVYSLLSSIPDEKYKFYAEIIKRYILNINVRFFKVYIKESSALYEANNPYQKLVSSKIEETDITEIKIN
jgi:putative CRISPR-associated protein (TIGR02619 family)